MKSLAKAAIIICCLLLSCYAALQGHHEMASGYFLFAVAVAAFYEAQWK